MNAYTMHGKYIIIFLLFVNILNINYLFQRAPWRLPKQVWLGKWDMKINM